MSTDLPPMKTVIKRPERLSRRKLIKWSIIVALILLAVFFGIRYWLYSRNFASTDNAYINAHTIEIAAQVGGPVAYVYVSNNQQVRLGDPLFDIDPNTYQLALNKAQAQLQLADQAVAEGDAGVAAATAQVAQREAELHIAQSNNARMQNLVKQGFLSQQGSENSRTQVETMTAILRTAQANLEQARSAIGGRNANVQAARAAVDQARLDLRRTHIVSPANGNVANLSLRPGDTVQPGTPIFTVISSQEFWADANFKETQLERIRPGQAATITVDMYPNHPFKGVVESMSGGSGTVFSLLPPQNATGNWVKVTQRVPVRVRFSNPDPNFPLRIGTTATVEVRIRD